MKPPKVTPRRSTVTNETLIEVTFPSGRGCLVSIREHTFGVIEVYRGDPGVVVIGVPHKKESTV